MSALPQQSPARMLTHHPPRLMRGPAITTVTGAREQASPSRDGPPKVIDARARIRWRGPPRGIWTGSRRRCIRCWAPRTRRAAGGGSASTGWRQSAHTRSPTAPPGRRRRSSPTTNGHRADAAATASPTVSACPADSPVHAGFTSDGRPATGAGATTAGGAWPCPSRPARSTECSDAGGRLDRASSHRFLRRCHPVLDRSGEA
jgi:hypothetical protein